MLWKIILPPVAISRLLRSKIYNFKQSRLLLYYTIRVNNQREVQRVARRQDVCKIWTPTTRRQDDISRSRPQTACCMNSSYIFALHEVEKDRTDPRVGRSRVCTQHQRPCRRPLRPERGLLWPCGRCLHTPARRRRRRPTTTLLSTMTLQFASARS